MQILGNKNVLKSDQKCKNDQKVQVSWSKECLMNLLENRVRRPVCLDFSERRMFNPDSWNQCFFPGCFSFKEAQFPFLLEKGSFIIIFIIIILTRPTQNSTQGLNSWPWDHDLRSKVRCLTYRTPQAPLEKGFKGR